MLLFLLDDLVDSLADLSQLLLVLLERAHIVLTLDVVHSDGQGHKRDNRVGFESPTSPCEHKQDHRHAIVDGRWTPQVLVRQHIE